MIPAVADSPSHSFFPRTKHREALPESLVDRLPLR
jgi:hypothetical protein